MADDLRLAPGGALDQAFDQLQREAHQYAELAPEDFSAAIDLAKSIIEQTLRLVPEKARAAQTQRVCERLEFLKNVMFVGQNGFSRSAPDFDEQANLYDAPIRNGNSVHLELGTFTVWPQSRADQFVEEQGIGDIIRVDFNPAFHPDIAASVTALPFADESIDRIASNSLFEHVAYPHEIIREAFRVLRPGGILLTTVPFHYIQHGCPNDYLRYTGQFFDEICSAAGFTVVRSDSYACSGVYYTLHQLLKGCTAGPTDHPCGKAGEFAHILVTVLIGALQAFDDFFLGGGVNHFQATRALAVKPGPYVSPARGPDRTRPFLDRCDTLICPASGLPLRRDGDSLVSLNGLYRYEIVDGIPNLVVKHGFGSSFRGRASSRRQLEAWHLGLRDASTVADALWRAARRRLAEGSAGDQEPGEADAQPLDIDEQALLLRTSGAFDEGWYLATNPGVAAAGADPVVHYLASGAGEGRDPSPDFDTKSYLSRHPALIVAKANPLLHCILFGEPPVRRREPEDPFAQGYRLARGMITPELGRAWIAWVPVEFGAGDTEEGPNSSLLRLFENETALGPPHSIHVDIREKGGGAYSHWRTRLWFSTSDGSDPRANGREYLIFRDTTND